MVGSDFQRERAEREAEFRSVDVEDSTVPTVAEAVKHLKCETPCAVPKAEVAIEGSIVPQALSGQDHTVGVGNGVAHFTAPNVRLESGDHLHFILPTFGNDDA